MSRLMEFWGVEVKSGQPLKINPGDNKIVHLSQASLGEVKKDKGRESVLLYLNVDDKKLVLGTLSAQKFPQLNFDLVIEKDFELSHNGKNESVYFSGYKLGIKDGTDDDDSDSDKDVKEIQLVSTEKSELQAKRSLDNPNAVKPSAFNMKDVKPNQKADDSDSDDSDLNATSSDDDESGDDETLNLVNRKSGSDESSGELDESDDDEDTDESDSDDEDEETPNKAEPSKKRPAESATKALVPDKKAKFITPEKTEGRKGVSHTATPHPSKKSGKTPANSDQTKQQPKKSGSSFPCKLCNRSFTTEGGLQSHTKAKHSDAA